MKQQTAGRRLFLIGGTVLVLLFLYHVWPTPYSYFTIGFPDAHLGRIGYLTQRQEILTRRGWIDRTEWKGDE